MLPGVYVAVEGPTGIGKTTLAERLATELDALLLLDPYLQNPSLPDLIGGSSDPALAVQVELTFVALRVAQLRRIAASLAAGRTIVADWALMKQTIFAATSLEPDDTARVAATVDLWADTVPVPNLLIGLSASTATLRTRIRRRGRAFEAGLTDGHLVGLSAAFSTAYATWPGRLLPVDADTFDVFDNQHVRDLTRDVREALTLMEAS